MAVSRSVEFEDGHRPWTNPLGFEHGPAAPSWDTSHATKVRIAMQSWMGSPDTMSIHAEKVKSGEPAASGSFDRYDQAHAFLNELWDNPQQSEQVLYRGARRNESPGIKSYSEHRHIAQRFAKKYGGKVVELRSPVGLQMRKYVSSAYNDYEQQWVIDETDPRNQR